MSHNELDHWRDLARRRPLTEAEVTRLRAALAGVRAPSEPWDEELALTRLLSRLPDAPVASNFTSRVLEAVDAAPAPRAFGQSWRDWLAIIRPVPRFAAMAIALLAIPLGYARYQSITRTHIAHSLASIAPSVDAAAQAARIPPAEILADFDAINRLRQARGTADLELLAGLGSGGEP
jgi:hypothetical protein